MKFVALGGMTSAMATLVAPESFALVICSIALPSAALLLALSAVLVLAYTVLKSQKTCSVISDRLSEYCIFVYSSFLKPHTEGDEVGQQAALESFYKVQVACTRNSTATFVAVLIQMTRPTSTMQRGKDCCVAGKTCWLWLQLN